MLGKYFSWGEYYEPNTCFTHSYVFSGHSTKLSNYTPSSPAASPDLEIIGSSPNFETPVNSGFPIYPPLPQSSTTQQQQHYTHISQPFKIYPLLPKSSQIYPLVSEPSRIYPLEPKTSQKYRIVPKSMADESSSIQQHQAPINLSYVNAQTTSTGLSYAQPFYLLMDDQNTISTGNNLHNLIPIQQQRILTGLGTVPVQTIARPATIMTHQQQQYSNSDSLTSNSGNGIYWNEPNGRTIQIVNVLSTLDGRIVCVLKNDQITPTVSYQSTTLSDHHNRTVIVSQQQQQQQSEIYELKPKPSTLSANFPAVQLEIPESIVSSSIVDSNAVEHHHNYCYDCTTDGQQQSVATGNNSSVATGSNSSVAVPSYGRNTKRAYHRYESDVNNGGCQTKIKRTRRK